MLIGAVVTAVLLITWNIWLMLREAGFIGKLVSGVELLQFVCWVILWLVLTVVHTWHDFEIVLPFIFLMIPIALLAGRSSKS